jgi:hypothetical protein
MTRPIDALPRGWRGLSSGLRGGQARSNVMRLVIPRKLMGLAATEPVLPLLMATIGSLLRCCQLFLSANPYFAESLSVFRRLPHLLLYFPTLSFER